MKFGCELYCYFLAYISWFDGMNMYLLEIEVCMWQVPFQLV